LAVAFFFSSFGFLSVDFVDFEVLAAFLSPFLSPLLKVIDD